MTARILAWKTPKGTKSLTLTTVLPIKPQYTKHNCRNEMLALSAFFFSSNEWTDHVCMACQSPRRCSVTESSHPIPQCTPCGICSQFFCVCVHLIWHTHAHTHTTQCLISLGAEWKCIGRICGGVQMEDMMKGRWQNVRLLPLAYANQPATYLMPNTVYAHGPLRLPWLGLACLWPACCSNSWFPSRLHLSPSSFLFPKQHKGSLSHWSRVRRRTTAGCHSCEWQSVTVTICSRAGSNLCMIVKCHVTQTVVLKILAHTLWWDSFEFHSANPFLFFFFILACQFQMSGLHVAL